MQVTKDNFIKSLPLIRQAIKEADFIAVDTELTGLHSDNSRSKNDYLDTLQDRYLKVKHSSNSFVINQYGICAFKYDTEKKKYIAKPMNFYVFPRSGPKMYGLHRPFLCQGSSIEFLDKCNFDFNRWIKDGISYLNLDQEQRIRERLSKFEEKKENETLNIDEKEQQFFNDFKQRMHDWLQNSTEKKIKISCANSYQKKIVHHTVRQETNGFVVANGISSAEIELIKVTEEERKELEEKKSKQSEQTLQETIGFRVVMDLLRESKKPLIGHNMYLDLAQTMHQFVRPLPDTYVSFRESLQEEFPIIYDTKFLAISSPELAEHISKTNLSNVYSRVQSKPFVCPDIEFDKAFSYPKRSGDQFHEAAFDAYTTGYAFARMMALVTKKTQLIDLDKHDFKNRLNIMYSDMEYIDLENEQDTPGRSHIFHLKEIPSEFMDKQLDEALNAEAVGGYFYRWKTSNECFVMLKDKSKLEIFMKLKETGSFNIQDMMMSSFENWKSKQLVMEKVEEEDQHKKKRKRVD